jgi:hypothetical protein
MLTQPIQTQPIQTQPIQTQPIQTQPRITVDISYFDGNHPVAIIIAITFLVTKLNRSK